MKQKGFLKTVVAAWLAAGTIDILGAIFILGNGSAAGTFKYITAAALDSQVTLSSTQAIVAGLVFHYIIALCWTVFYFLLYKPTRLYKLPLLLSALLYGCIIFFSMRYVFIPVLGHLPPPRPISNALLPGIIKNILVLSAAFGLTLNYFAARLYAVKK